MHTMCKTERKEGGKEERFVLLVLLEITLQNYIFFNPRKCKLLIVRTQSDKKDDIILNV